MEHFIETIRTTRRRLIPSRWQSITKNILKNPTVLRPHLLEIPPELRLEICSFIQHEPIDKHAHASPQNDHLYPLLSVCKLLRKEVGRLFYDTPVLCFLNPRPCTFFLEKTRMHLSLLRGLEIDLCGDSTYFLEPILRLLTADDVPLSYLVLRLLLVHGDAKPERPPQGMMLAPAVGRALLSQARSYARQRSSSFDTELSTAPLPDTLPTSEAPPVASSISKSALESIKTIRYLGIFGHPSGDWATEFELAVLQIHCRMFEIAVEEGKKMFKGPGPLRSEYTYDTYWLHNDVWIEGSKVTQEERQ